MHASLISVKKMMPVAIYGIFMKAGPLAGGAESVAIFSIYHLWSQEFLFEPCTYNFLTMYYIQSVLYLGYVCSLVCTVSVCISEEKVTF